MCLRRICVHASALRRLKKTDSISESDNVSESGVESLLFDGESAESDYPPQEEAGAESPSPPLRRSTCQKRLPSSCHLCDQEIRWGCNKNNDLPLNPKRARTCFTCEVRKYS